MRISRSRGSLLVGRAAPVPATRPRRTRQPPTSCRFSLRCRQVDFDDLLARPPVGRRSPPLAARRLDHGLLVPCLIEPPLHNPLAKRPAGTRGCPDRSGALACIKSARTGGVVASGPSASMGPEPQRTGGSFLFYGTAPIQTFSPTTLRCNCSCLPALGASARAGRQPPSTDTPPRSSNKSKDRSLEPPPARGSSFFK
jgi:hypothetical protein